MRVYRTIPRPAVMLVAVNFYDDAVSHNALTVHEIEPECIDSGILNHRGEILYAQDTKEPLGFQLRKP